MGVGDFESAKMVARKWLCFFFFCFSLISAGMVLHTCITKVTFCIVVTRITVFEVNALQQTSSCHHAIDGHGHCHQQASSVRNGCYVDKNASISS